HGSIGPADVELMAMAADAAGMTTIARPRSNAAADIQHVLDRGVAGVQIPHINTRADAERAVAAVKFGPGAARGLAAGTRPDRWGLGGRMSDFAAHANAQSLVCVQIEHEEAIANIDEILNVDGIDVFFIGPSDLSQSMVSLANQHKSAERRRAKRPSGIKRARLPSQPRARKPLLGDEISGYRTEYSRCGQQGQDLGCSGVRRSAHCARLGGDG